MGPPGPPLPIWGGVPHAEGTPNSGGSSPIFGAQPQAAIPIWEDPSAVPHSTPTFKEHPAASLLGGGGGNFRGPPLPTRTCGCSRGGCVLGGLFFWEGGGAYAWMLLLVLKAR